MKTLKMKLTGADIKVTQKGDRQYLKAQFSGVFDGETVKASINLNANEENNALVSDLINNEFTTIIEFDEKAIVNKEFDGAMRHYIGKDGVKNIADVKEAMGLPKGSIENALNAKLWKKN